MRDDLKSPFPGYEWVRHPASDLFFPDGSVEEGYQLKKISATPKPPADPPPGADRSQ